MNGIRAVMVMLWVGSGCLLQSPVMRFGSGKSAKENQRTEMRRWTPPQLVADGTWTGATTAVQVRVWADDEYRAQHLHWKDAFAAQLDYANEVLGPLLGIQLQPQYREWSYRAEPGASLEDRLHALAAQDPGDDVFAVIALTSSIALVAGEFDQLGVAELGGRHMVLRGHADVEERAMFDAAFRDLSADDREYLYALRRRHKETALLLHELAHTLGVAHESEVDTLMYPIYSDRSTSFTAQSRDLMQATVAARLGRGAPAPTMDEHPTLVIRIAANGAVSIAGVELTANSLGEMLKLTKEDDPDTQVIIRAQTGAPPEIIERVGKRVEAAGLGRVANQTGD
jgi:biopolymer transport protein ExbD